jgi:hypothetical protein
MEIEEQEPEVVEQSTNRFTAFLGGVLLLAVIAGVVLLALAILPDTAPPLPKNAGWLDFIIDNRWVIWLIRLAGLAGSVMFSVFSVYFIRSLNHRIRQGHWLRSGGPFQAEIVEKAGDALEDAEEAWGLLAEAEARNQELEVQLAQTNQAVENVYQAFVEANRQVEEFRARLEGEEEEPPERG